MTYGLSNAKLDSELFLEIVKEFRQFIAGGGTSNNLLSFIDPKNEEERKLLNEFVNNFEYGYEETADQQIKDQIMFTISLSKEHLMIVKKL